jgi:hypothetical protein
MPKKARRKSIRQPLRWPRVMPRSMTSPSTWWKHRGMRGVVVGTVGAAGNDDADRRFLGQHGADLHRRGVGAQHGAAAIHFRQVEGVVVLACRVVVGNVERAEIVPVALDVGAFGDGEAHGAEQGGEFFHRARDGVNAAIGGGAGGGGAWRQGDVDAFGGEAGVESGRIEHDAAGFQRRLDPALQPVQRGAAFLALVLQARRRGPSTAPSGCRTCRGRPRGRHPARADRSRRPGRLRSRPAGKRGRHSWGRSCPTNARRAAPRSPGKRPSAKR